VKFADADITAMLAAMGEAVTIGATAATGLFSEPGRPVVRDGMTVVTTTPSLLLAEADAALVTINSTTITVAGVQYQAFLKTPDGAGFVDLDLTRDF